MPRGANASRSDRIRLRLSGTFFDLTERFAVGPLPLPGTPVADIELDDPALVISVAKRLVASAVRRNTVKRIVREAWRAAVQGTPEARCRLGGGGTYLVRLKRYPGSAAKAGKAVRSGGSAGSARSMKPDVVAESSRLPGLATIKRQLRADADSLFAALLNGRSGPTRFT